MAGVEVVEGAEDKDAHAASIAICHCPFAICHLKIANGKSQMDNGKLLRP